MSGKDRILRLFLENKGEIVTHKQIANAALITSWPRRVRELREAGWLILSNNDDATLKPGEYRLEGERPGDHSRAERRPLSATIRVQVLERDESTCKICGAGLEDIDPQFPHRKVRLHVDHIVPRSKGGGDEMDNLRTLCSTCNQGLNNLTQ